MRSHRAVAVFLLDVGRTANELAAGVVIDKQGRVAADIGHRAIDDRMILEFRHARNFGATDDAVLQRDPGVEGFGKRHRQRAEIDVDIPLRAFAKFRRQRPIGGSDHKRRVHGDQEDGAHDCLGAEPELQRRQELSNGPCSHENGPSKRA